MTDTKFKEIAQRSITLAGILLIMGMVILGVVTIFRYALSTTQPPQGLQKIPFVFQGDLSECRLYRLHQGFETHTFVYCPQRRGS